MPSVLAILPLGIGALVALSPALAGDWRLVERDWDYYLTHPDQGEVAIQPAAGAPRFLAEVPWGQGLTRLVYDAGEAGTSVLVGIERAVLLDVEGGEVLGDFPYRYRTRQGGQSFTQPRWTLSGDAFAIHDPNEGLAHRQALPEALVEAYLVDPCADIHLRAESQVDPQAALGELGGCLASRQRGAVFPPVVAAMVRQSVAAGEFEAACRYGELLREMRGAETLAPEPSDALAQGLAYCPP
ncbi:hypothetical protein [Halomonas salifodinae]|uniref:hypothetical protein n=1 Tax=Halomonas salifodinae TaxID=438745 RepID=UPI0033BF1AE6